MNHGYTYSGKIDARAAGRSLLDWLASEYDHSTRDEWVQRIAEGRVLLDAKPASRDDVLRAGQTLSWVRPPWEEPEVPLEFDVVHEDAHLLVVAKPSGLPTMPAGGFLEHTLLAQVQKRDKKWAPIHRLGRGTSGLVVFASPQAAPEANRIFRTHEIEKRYLARVTGTLEPQVIEAPIGLVPHSRMGELWAVSASGAFAKTIVERVDGPLATVRIVTGKPHQIRIHLAHVGNPLEGDPLYAANGVLLDATPGEVGYFLRAVELAFAHPMTGAPLRITCAHSARWDASPASS